MACDICHKALKVAKKNAICHTPKMPKSTRLFFLKSDRFFHFGLKAHTIISNPPYIKTRADRTHVHPQVLQYEPHKALFIEDELYETWYRDFFCQVNTLLMPKGYFFMEGHGAHLEKLKNILEEWPFDDTEILNDLCGRKRILKAKKS